MAAVLLVEDVRDGRDIYRTILEFAGHSVFEAGSGAEALAAVRTLTPDVIVMDVTMPVMDGLEATRQLKGDPSTAIIPVLILTAHARRSDRDNAISSGADAYLAKPCAPREVLVAVEQLIRDRVARGDEGR
jgi:CheY-like chemotaxis protein